MSTITLSVDYPAAGSSGAATVIAPGGDANTITVAFDATHYGIENSFFFQLDLNGFVVFVNDLNGNALAAFPDGSWNTGGPSWGPFGDVPIYLQNFMIPTTSTLSSGNWGTTFDLCGLSIGTGYSIVLRLNSGSSYISSSAVTIWTSPIAIADVYVEPDLTLVADAQVGQWYWGCPANAAGAVSVQIADNSTEASATVNTVPLSSSTPGGLAALSAGSQIVIDLTDIGLEPPVTSTDNLTVTFQWSTAQTPLPDGFDTDAATYVTSLTACIADDDGVTVAMADGTKKPLSAVAVGDVVATPGGGGNRVTGVFSNQMPVELLATLPAGRYGASAPLRLTSTHAFWTSPAAFLAHQPPLTLADVGIHERAARPSWSASPAFRSVITTPTRGDLLLPTAATAAASGRATPAMRRSVKMPNVVAVQSRRSFVASPAATAAAAAAPPSTTPPLAITDGDHSSTSPNTLTSGAAVGRKRVYNFRLDRSRVMIVNDVVLVGYGDY